MPKGNPDGYVDTGASIEDAAMDLDPADFIALMEELGIKLQGPMPERISVNPMPAEPPAADKLGVIRDRIRSLVQRGFSLRPEGASEFTANEMLQRRMQSYYGPGTAESARIMAERMGRK